jgi:hypothetical protein
MKSIVLVALLWTGLAVASFAQDAERDFEAHGANPMRGLALNRTGAPRRPPLGGAAPLTPRWEALPDPPFSSPPVMNVFH